MSHNKESNNDETPKVLGLAIVGCGQIVTHHIEAMASALAGKLELRALVDPSPERRSVIQDLATTKYGPQLYKQEPRPFDTLDQLMMAGDDEFFATQIDIIFIAVPHDLHESLAIQALFVDGDTKNSTTGKIVVMEKPLAPTRDSCDTLVQVSEDLLQKGTTTTTATKTKSSSMLIIAEQSPYWQEVALARSIIAEAGDNNNNTNDKKRKREIDNNGGDIGHIVTAASYYYESMRDNVTSGSVEASGGMGWRGSLKRAGGGITIDGGLHWIRPLREMLGRRITKVVAVARRNLEPKLQMEGESCAHALLEMEAAANFDEPKGSGPLVATYSCNMLATAPMAHDACPYFRITGTKGELIIHGDGLFRENPGAGGLRLYNDEHPHGKELFPADRRGGFFLGFSGLWKEIYRIGTAGDYQAAHESVLRAADDVRVALAMYKSAKSSQWETV